MILSGENWRKQLAAWAIPESILNQAEESPWIHPPALFEFDGRYSAMEQKPNGKFQTSTQKSLSFIDI